MRLSLFLPAVRPQKRIWKRIFGSHGTNTASLHETFEIASYPIPNRIIGGTMKITYGAAALATTMALATPALAQGPNAQGPAPVGIISWILVGLVSGYLASRVVNKHGEGFIRDVLLGIIGAFIGGIIMHFFGSTGVTGFNAWSILVAFFGAVVLLVIYHALRREPSRA
jgi:uncharacterized membrane protein YeaQ/YmgE (transglycosylase-associated protein family)